MIVGASASWRIVRDISIVGASASWRIVREPFVVGASASWRIIRELALAPTINVKLSFSICHLAANPDQAMNKIKRALISVSDKTGIEEFARALQGMGVEILSTGGTARLLAEAGRAGDGGVGLHRFSGDDGRAGEDAAPEDSRRHSRAARHR